MAARKRTDAETWAAIENARDDQDAREIAAMSSEEVDKELREDGFDPAAVRARGAAFVEKLRERHARLGWQAGAREKLERVQALANQRKGKYASLPRAELLARIATAKSDPRFSGQVAMMFRKRGEGESSDEVLAELLEKLDVLAELADDEGTEKK
jgi:hypothetical protein